MKAFPEIFSIVDVETSGMRPASSRIIDIGIIRVENGEVVDRYQTLINPGTQLPPSITYLTGIKTGNLYDAPSFDEVALEIEALLKDAVFVAHNASFDYRFVQSEFARIGMQFAAPTLCSVRLSRVLTPRERHHNLDAIMQRYGISCSTRHRALPDAEVVLRFFERISKTYDPDELREYIEHVQGGAVRKKDPLVRPDAILGKQAFANLPESAGVYFFYGPEDELLYIGKSKHVRTRARSHFHTSDSRKEQRLQQETSAIQTITTTGELSALLLESSLIKQESPLYNRALRKRKLLVAALARTTPEGYTQVVLERVEAVPTDVSVLGVFKTITQAKTKLKTLAKEHQLCAKLLGIETAQGACFGSQLGTCDGACAGKIPAEEYNARVAAAFEKRKLHTWPYKGTVRITEQATEDSGSVFFIRDWVLLGSFTYEQGEYTPLLPGSDTFDYDQYKILARYLLDRKNKGSITVLTDRDYQKQLALCTGSYEAALY